MTRTTAGPAHRLEEQRQRTRLDRQLAAVPDTALPDEPDGRSRLAAAVLLVVLLLIGGGILLLATRGSDTEDQRDAAAGQVLDLAAQIQAECNAGRLAGAICQQADDAAADPIPGVPGVPGADGAPGTPGADGLDGAPGTPGLDGSPGAPGLPGIDGAPGPDGAPGQDGSDGTDGADGAQGQPGEPPAGFTFVDGTGTEQTCTRDPASPDDAAFYRCTAPADGVAEPAVMGLTLFR